ncbi:MAG TPA: radical SAM family heme chaperone HemW, partial [Chitinophagaceae bacterium]|nr:radical SAM family heme chaperone HemW [Chitinophagaceae bacterium]
MAGIYIHIPFCKQACTYCNFHFSTSLLYKNELLSALLKEMEMRSSRSGAYLDPGEKIDTIYLGGGTPSLLDAGETEKLVQTIYSLYPVSPGAEVTLEANPDDITNEKLSGWKNAGINRLSIGIQGFDDKELFWMNRAHHAQQAHQCLELAFPAFKNISVDLIYGTPMLDDTSWKKNVDKITSMGIPHLSCYALTVEPKTPLYKMIRDQRSEDVNPDQQARQFMLLMEWMEKAGYEHYEISNFAKPGQRSKHNSSYWRGTSYLGMGPSAHSYNGISRQWNVSNNTTYINSIQSGMLPAEIETLTA